jgi:hypothetical protein
MIIVYNEPTLDTGWNLVNDTLMSAPHFSLSKLRRNHALEHASIHVLSKRFPHRRFIGRSDFKGFYLITDLTLDKTSEGIHSALGRLQAGESHLAVHPNCGTNLLTGAFLAALSSSLVFNAPRDRKRWTDILDLFPLALIATMFSLVLAQPIGSWLQKSLTTRSDLNYSSILSITGKPSGRYSIYRVLTQHD